MANKEVLAQATRFAAIMLASQWSNGGDTR
jgi:hypothetical protein